MSVEIIAEHAGTVMDTLFCAVGSVGSLELPLAQAGFHTGTSRAQETHQHQPRQAKRRKSAQKSYLVHLVNSIFKQIL